MAVIVPPDLVAQAVEFGIPSADAEECLRRTNNNVEEAINYYYNGNLERDRNENKWDEKAWGADRYGPEPNPEGNVNALDYLAVAADQAFRDPIGAKSRPPSPSNTFQIHHPTDGEDADLQQAIKASMEDSQRSGQNYPTYTGPQTTGTVAYTPASNFKRADNDTQYDSGAWALAVRGQGETSAIEIFLDPPPSERKRVPEQPAFLRPSTGSGSLGPLLTILHSIPTARDVLLQKDHILEDYGQQKNWWAGHIIQIPRVVDEDDLDPIPPENLEVVRESQRLMAFLSGTERAYGTAESLGSIHNIFDANPGLIVSNYFCSLRDAIKLLHGDPDMRTPLLSRAVKVSPNGEEGSQIFEVFDLTIKSHVVEQGGNLYDALDTIFWDEPDESEVYAEYFGDVCTIQATTEDPNKRPCGIDIPAEMYFDRYTKEFKDHVADMKKAKVEIQGKIDELSAKERKIRLYSPMFQPNSSLDMVKVMARTRRYFELSSDPDSVLPTGGVVPEEHARKCSETARQLAEIEERIQKKLSDLKKQRDELRDRLEKLKSIFTTAENTVEGAPPLQKYLLRGVSTDRGVTYIRREKLVPHINLEEDGAPTEIKKQLEWWSIKYHTMQLAYSEESYSSYDIKVVSEEEVLRAARFEGTGLVLLAYAKEEPADVKQTIGLEDLPEALQKFVHQDNENFAREIAEAATRPQSYSKKRPHDQEWNTDKPYANREYTRQWESHYQGGTANSSRNATPGSSRRNSFDMADDNDLNDDVLKTIPRPPSPPAAPNVSFAPSGPTVHFADQAKGFQGAYGSRHEVMAIEEEGKARQKPVQADDEMTHGSQHIEFAEDGTLREAVMPIPPPPPPPSHRGIRFNLDE
ncbi:hypothetical protein AOL_s00079g301 [Orbilia oligospora ATCC 24927]|uniref:UBA domain-containing protein n=2 Tax=Orbilia oligospora TaxID=2813651 RepID=G1XDB6_ARTOA|nr:hypothetical protein AOL_s00079g301 [Orbilia oligospora ATCC 24927]EGX48662.1 hypothetical protein AOL_s00079g301 [Orbilia oligospora ATCC 24927]KAF3275690.1 hypothetical protein TWF970_006596 [Orbilia oligospora]